MMQKSGAGQVATSPRADRADVLLADRADDGDPRPTRPAGRPRPPRRQMSPAALWHRPIRGRARRRPRSGPGSRPARCRCGRAARCGANRCRSCRRRCRPHRSRRRARGRSSSRQERDRARPRSCWCSESRPDRAAVRSPSHRRSPCARVHVMQRGRHGRPPPLQRSAHDRSARVACRRCALRSRIGRGWRAPHSTESSADRYPHPGNSGTGSTSQTTSRPSMSATLDAEQIGAEQASRRLGQAGDP